MLAKKSVLNDIWQNTILPAAQTGALASSFSKCLCHELYFWPYYTFGENTCIL